MTDVLQRLRAADLRLPLLLGGLGVALVLETIMFVSFVGGLHEPKPHRVPVAVVGPPPVAESFAARIETAADGAIDVDVLPS